MKLTRRDMLALAAGAPMAGWAASNKDGLIIQSSRPPDYEMKLEGYSDWITPEEHLYVRSHHYTADVKLAEWSLKVSGLVEKPLTMSLDDLKKLPRVTYVAVMECAGNGRSFYEPHIPGMQWKYGGVGNCRWTGVRLAEVMKRAGLKSSALHLLFDGADVPVGKMPKFQRTVEVKKALDPDTILAFEMNGKALTAEHGFPVRLVVPGWASDSWVKWVQGIEAIDHEFDGFFMKTAYRHPAKHVEPGSAVAPGDMIPVTDLSIKSVIAGPAGAWAAPGKVKISGAAWSNGSPIAGVDVSVDGGKTWGAAKLGKDHSKYAWRLWSYDWKAAEGTHKVLARAKDEAGKVQPMTPEWNPSGYLWNVSAPKEIVVAKVQPAGAPERKWPTAAEHPAGYKASCLPCHGEDIIRSQVLNSAQWDREVQKMVGWGAEIKAENKEAILAYLKANFRP